MMLKILHCRVRGIDSHLSLLLLPLLRSSLSPVQEIDTYDMTASNILLLLSDMPADILNCIQEHLSLVDYLRFPAVCRSFRSAAKQISHLPFSDTHFPWLLCCGSFFKDDFTAAAMIPVSPHPKTYSIPFPPLFKGFNILSSNRPSLFTEYQHSDKGPKGIYILNPFDSWAQLGRLPSSTDIGGIFNLAINDANTVVLGIYREGLAYTRMSDDDHTDRGRWISLNDTLPPPTDMFRDVVAYKDDLFYAVQMNATNVLQLDFSRSSPTAPPVRVTDMTLNLQLSSETPGWSSFQNSRLTSSPSGLFLVRWRCLLMTGSDDHIMKRREIDIYRLMDDKYAPNKWVHINSLDNFSFFFSLYSSISLSPVEFPTLRTNRIYLPRDAVWNITHDYDNSDDIDDDNHDDSSYHLMYDLGDGSWEQICGDEYIVGMWVTPRLRPNSLLLG